jgi:hypothetical protein
LADKNLVYGLVFLYFSLTLLKWALYWFGRQNGDRQREWSITKSAQNNPPIGLLQCSGQAALTACGA